MSRPSGFPACRRGAGADAARAGLLLALDGPFIIMTIMPVVMAVATAMTLITIISIGDIVVQLFLPRSNGDAPPGHFRLFIRSGSIIVIAQIVAKFLHVMMGVVRGPTRLPLHRSAYPAMIRRDRTGPPTDSFGALIAAFTKTDKGVEQRNFIT
jgi:hypothetical protein